MSAQLRLGPITESGESPVLARRLCMLFMSQNRGRDRVQVYELHAPVRVPVARNSDRFTVLCLRAGTSALPQRPRRWAPGGQLTTRSWCAWWIETAT